MIKRETRSFVFSVFFSGYFSDVLDMTFLLLCDCSCMIEFFGRSYIQKLSELSKFEFVVVSDIFGFTAKKCEVMHL